MHLHCMSLQYDAFSFRYHDMATLNFHSTICVMNFYSTLISFHLTEKYDTMSREAGSAISSLYLARWNFLLHISIYSDFHLK